MNMNKNNFAGSFSVSFTQKKNKNVFILFRYEEILNYDFFFEKMKNQLTVGSYYTMFIKLRYDTRNFRFCGKQVGFNFNLDDLNSLFNIIQERIVIATDRYDIESDSIDVIGLSFIELDKTIKSGIEIDKDLLYDTNKTSKNNITKFKEIPLIVNDNIGDLLDLSYDDNGIINNIKLIINNEEVNFLDKIKLSVSLSNTKKNKDPIEFDNSYKFYKVIENNKTYILCIKSYDDFIEKTKYSLNGIIIKQIEDKLLEKDVYSRKIDNSESIITDNKVVYFKQNLNLSPLRKPKIDSLFVPNPNIGVLDTETYKDMDGVNKIFCLGFKTNLSNECKTYYIDHDTLDSDKIVIELIDEILRPKYDIIKIFFCHNLSGYDIVFILKVLVTYNQKYGEKYSFKFLFKDEKAINVTITVKDSENRKRSVTLGDSYFLLNNKLSDLAKTFEVDTLKGLFPYEFSRRENLFYIGDVPPIKYYNNIDPFEYDKLSKNFKNKWNFKEQSLQYLNDDLLALYQVLDKANRQVFNDFNVNLIESKTISSLATKIFLKDYYNDNIPSINKSSLYRDIKEAYYGGITEVYKPKGKDLFYYDVNSLYPYVSKYNDMPGVEAYYENFSINANLDKLFGFYYCEVECKENLYLGLLPKRTSSGLNFPLGKWKGWYFSEELKFAEKHGYNIKVIKGYNFNRVKDTFTEYIDFVYNFKQNPINNTQKTMAKSLLNNLLGRFGIQLERDITVLVDKNTFQRLSLMYKITSYKHLTMDDILVTYTPLLDNELINNNNLDIVKILEKYPEREFNTVQNASIAISAAVTAYARIHITNLKLQILDKGGEIYYSDTDSIVTNIELSNDMVNNKLGGLKLEHRIKEGIFISGKTYCFINDKLEFINRAKGVKSNSLNHSDYISLFNGENVNTALKTSSKKNWELGDVDITTEKITLYHDSFRKREKVFKFGKWVDTKPWIINENDIINSTNNNKLNKLTTNPNNYSNIIDILKQVIIHKNMSILDRIKLDKDKIKSFLILLLLMMFYLVSFYEKYDNDDYYNEEILETEITQEEDLKETFPYNEPIIENRLLDYIKEEEDSSNESYDCGKVYELEDNSFDDRKEEIEFFNQLQENLEKEYYMKKMSNTLLDLYISTIENQTDTNIDESLLSNTSYVTAQEQIELDEIDNTFSEIQKSNMIWILTPLNEEKPEWLKNPSDTIPSKTELAKLSKDCIILTSKICDIESLAKDSITIPSTDTDIKQQTFVSHTINYNEQKFECRAFVNESYLIEENNSTNEDNVSVNTVIPSQNEKSSNTNWMENEDYGINKLFNDNKNKMKKSNH